MNNNNYLDILKQIVQKLTDTATGQKYGQEVATPVPNALTNPALLNYAQGNQQASSMTPQQPQPLDLTVQYPQWVANAPQQPQQPQQQSQQVNPQVVQQIIQALQQAPAAIQQGVGQAIGQATGQATGEFKKEASVGWDQFVKMATDAAVKAGIPPSVLVSQAAIESGRGTSNFAQNRNNYFGYQAYDSNPNAAKGYATPQHSIDDVIKWYKSHPDVMAKKDDPVAFAQAVKNAGYASDPNYVNKVTSTPEFKKLMNVKPAQPNVQQKAPVIPNLNKNPHVISPLPQAFIQKLTGVNRG